MIWKGKYDYIKMTISYNCQNNVKIIFHQCQINIAEYQSDFQIGVPPHISLPI